MLDKIEKSTEKVALICTKTDRLQRGFAHLQTLKNLIEREKLEIHLVYENKILSTDTDSNDWLLFKITTAVAENFTDKISENVKQSNKHKLAMGEWCGSAPLGYINKRNEHNKSDIVIDDERAFIIRRMFEEFALGSDTLSSLTKKAGQWGLTSKKGYTISKNGIYEIINRRFYYGEMLVKGKIYSHRYHPIISKEMWEKCQSVIHRKNNRFKYGERPFVFRGIAKCAKCGCSMSPSFIKKPNGKTYTYLDCSSSSRQMHCGNSSVREDVILEQISEEVLSKFYIPVEVRNELMDRLNEGMNAETDFILREKELLQKQDANLRRKLNNFLDLLGDGIITNEEYTAKKCELDRQRRQIETRLNSFTRAI